MLGEKRLSFDEFLPIYHEQSDKQPLGCTESFIEAFRIFDLDNNGLVSAGEIRHLLTMLGRTYLWSLLFCLNLNNIARYPENNKTQERPKKGKEMANSKTQQVLYICKPTTAPNRFVPTEPRNKSFGNKKCACMKHPKNPEKIIVSIVRKSCWIEDLAFCLFLLNFFNSILGDRLTNDEVDILLQGVEDTSGKVHYEGKGNSRTRKIGIFKVYF